MPPILQSINEQYKNQGFDSQAKFFESKIPVNFEIPTFEVYKQQLSNINLQKEIDTGTTIIDADIPTGTTEILEEDEKLFIEEPLSVEEDEKLFIEEPVSVEAKKEDLNYANFAKDVYNKKNKRNNLNNFKYIEEDSDEILGTYYNSNTNELIQSIRGTSDVWDFRRNFGIALGSFGNIFISGEFNKINEKIKQNKTKYSPKKTTITGHSSGASLANYIGVQNPDYDVITFNMGQGLPFAKDIISCGLAGCKNIKNYRIAGDFASSLSSMFSQGSVFDLKPKIPTKEIETEAEIKESIFVPTELYIPHSIDQFIHRDDNLHPDPFVYGRKLARRAGGVSLAAGLPLLTYGVSSLVEGKIDKLAEQEIMNVRDEYLDINNFILGLEQSTGLEAPLTFYNMFNKQYNEDIKARVDTSKLKPIQKALNFIQGGSSGLQSLIGYGLGDIVGVMMYDNLFKSSEEQFANI
jgi:hypothetical protein